MNRTAPGTSELYIANADGSDEQKLLGNESTFDYHARMESGSLSLPNAMATAIR
jgi:hypothetical protein